MLIPDVGGSIPYASRKILCNYDILASKQRRAKYKKGVQARIEGPVPHFLDIGVAVMRLFDLGLKFTSRMILELGLRLFQHHKGRLQLLRGAAARTSIQTQLKRHSMTPGSLVFMSNISISTDKFYCLAASFKDSTFATEMNTVMGKFPPNPTVLAEMKAAHIAKTTSYTTQFNVYSAYTFRQTQAFTQTLPKKPSLQNSQAIGPKKAKVNRKRNPKSKSSRHTKKKPKTLPRPMSAAKMLAGKKKAEEIMLENSKHASLSREIAEPNSSN
jgi:hypothetical protein